MLLKCYAPLKNCIYFSVYKHLKEVGSYRYYTRIKTRRCVSIRTTKIIICIMVLFQILINTENGDVIVL